jgi:hypothetical protein
MAAIVSGTLPTLYEVVRRQNPDKSIADVVELLSEMNPILDDAVYLEGNMTDGHKCTVRSGLPSATWRKLNYGVQPDKSTTVQVVDRCGILESYAEVDKRLVQMSGNPKQFMLTEDMGFLQSMSQEMADTLFDGDTDTDPEKFMGLMPRYNDSTAANGDNIIKGEDSDSGGNDYTSIWLVVWGPNGVFCTYPKGGKGGFSREFLGEVTLTDGSSGRFQGYRTHYAWEMGLVVRDWRQIVRICDIDWGNTASTDTDASDFDLADLMIQALEQVEDLSMGRPVFYMNRKVRTMLRRQMLNKSNRYITEDKDWAGNKVTMFDGVPVRRCDAITVTEDFVS